MEQTVTVTIELPSSQAYALAELCKRLCWADARAMSVSEEETRCMIEATDRVRAALTRAGVFVR